MKKILALILAATSLATYAADGDSSGIYVGAGAGAAWNDTAFPAASFRLDGGYEFNNYFGIELGTTGVTQAGSGINQSEQFYDLSLKGTYSMTDMFSLVGLLGGAYASPGLIGSTMDTGPGGTGTGVNASNYQAGWDTLVAAGVQANLTRQISFNLMDYYYFGGVGPDGNTNVVLVGIKYKF